MFSAIATLLIAYQGAGQAPVDIMPENPQTWSVEYPIVMKPYVADYYACLQGGLKEITGKPEFEAQHRADIPRCAAELDELQRRANEALTRIGMDVQMPASEVAKVFSTIDYIHIERGRDIDSQFLVRLDDRDDNHPEYERDHHSDAEHDGHNDHSHEAADTMGVPTN